MEATPITRHELGLTYMNFRGKKAKFIYTQFAQDLAKDAGRYLPQQPQKPTARKADVHVMHSNKIPITMRADTARSQFNASKPATLCAVGDPGDFDDTFDAACTEPGGYDYSSGGVKEETSGKHVSGHVTDIVSAETHGG